MEEEKEDGETPKEEDKEEKSEIVKQTEEANKAAERMANEREQLEATIAKAKLAGVTEAGKPAEEKKEETNQEYVDRMRKNGWKADETK